MKYKMMTDSIEEAGARYHLEENIVSLNDNSLKPTKGRDIDWTQGHCDVFIGGAVYSIRDLEAIVWWMRNKK